MNFWIVVCKDDDGVYVLATRKHFFIEGDACRYANAVASGRQAIVVYCPRGVSYSDEQVKS
jgi:hypothetical protein